MGFEVKSIGVYLLPAVACDDDACQLGGVVRPVEPLAAIRIR